MPTGETCYDSCAAVQASEALEHINQMARDVKKTARQGLFPEPPADLSESSARGQEGAHLPDQLKGISQVCVCMVWEGMSK